MKEHVDLAEGMRLGMRRMAQGVTVLSALDENGGRVAMTASAVTSVSADPPALLVCVNRSASLYTSLEQKRPFCINVLREGMEAISNHCAFGESGEERFTVGDWKADEITGLPYLEGVEVTFFCEPELNEHYGTHLICVGRLTGVRTREDRAAPLLYADGAYARIKVD